MLFFWTFWSGQKKGKDHHFIKKASTDSIQHQHLVFCKTIRSETEVAQSHLLFTPLALHTLLTCQLILPYGFSAMVTWLLECIDVLKRQNRTNKQTKRKDFMFFSVQFFPQKNRPRANSYQVILNLLFWPILPSKADPTTTQLKN